MKKTFCFLAVLLGLIALALTVTPARAADDYNMRVALTNSVAGTTNNTASMDLGAAAPDAIWRYAYVKAAIPATPNATNSATTFLFTLQDSANNSTWANTTPLVQLQVAGASSITNTALSVKMPIPPAVRRYIRIQQISPAASGANTTVTNVYWLSTP